MSPNVPCTRITGTGCAVERQAKSLAPGGLMPGVCAPAGAAAAKQADDREQDDNALSRASGAQVTTPEPAVRRLRPGVRPPSAKRSGSGVSPRDRRRDPLGHRRAVLEAVAGAAADASTRRACSGCAGGDEVRVGRQLVAARARLVERRLAPAPGSARACSRARRRRSSACPQRSRRDRAEGPRRRAPPSHRARRCRRCRTSRGRSRPSRAPPAPPRRAAVEEQQLLARDGERDEVAEQLCEPAAAGPDDDIGLQPRAVAEHDRVALRLRARVHEPRAVRSACRTSVRTARCARSDARLGLEQDEREVVAARSWGTAARPPRRRAARPGCPAPPSSARTPPPSRPRCARTTRRHTRAADPRRTRPRARATASRARRAIAV